MQPCPCHVAPGTMHTPLRATSEAALQHHISPNFRGLPRPPSPQSWWHTLATEDAPSQQRRKSVDIHVPRLVRSMPMSMRMCMRLCMRMYVHVQPVHDVHAPARSRAGRARLANPRSRRRGAARCASSACTAGCRLSSSGYPHPRRAVQAAGPKCPGSQPPMRPPTAPEAHPLARCCPLGSRGEL